MPGGNLLITESMTGRVFEVDHDGQTVWEYWNPRRDEGKIVRITRAYRYPPGYFDAGRP